jgi:hypothetical protein
MQENATVSPVTPASKSWALMVAGEKFVFLTKLCIMVCSFGFVFGNLLTD